MSLVEFKQKEQATGPFIVGSTVALKGGGEIMTVRKPGKQSVVVDWHDANGNLCSAEFPPSMLAHADPEEREQKGAPDGSG